MKLVESETCGAVDIVQHSVNVWSTCEVIAERAAYIECYLGCSIMPGKRLKDHRAGVYQRLRLTHWGVLSRDRVGSGDPIRDMNGGKST